MSEDLIAAGEAMGLTGRDAQEAAIAAFGGVRVVVRAHRRPAVAVLAELGMAAMRLAAVYLLAVPAAGLFAVILQKTLIRVAAPPGTEVVTAPVDYVHTFGVLAVSAITGLALLAGYRLAARRRTRAVRWPGGLVSGTLLGGYFPLAAVTCMLILVLFVIPLPRTITFPGEAFAAARLGAFAMAFGYAVQMAWILLRQRDTGEGVPHAG